MSLLESYKKEESEAVSAAEALSNRIAELEASVAGKDAELASVQGELKALKAQPPVVVKSDTVQVDFGPVLAAISALAERVAAIPAPVASGGSDAANWNKLWDLMANFQRALNESTSFMQAIRSRFGL